MELKNGGLYDITTTLPKAVEMPTSDFKCRICSQSFFWKQHLEMHAKYKHPSEVGVDLGTSTAALDNGSVDLCVQVNGQQEENRPPRQQKERTEN